MFCSCDNDIIGIVMEFQTFCYCYVLVFAMKMELVAVIITVIINLRFWKFCLIPDSAY